MIIQLVMSFAAAAVILLAGVVAMPFRSNWRLEILVQPPTQLSRGNLEKLCWCRKQQI